MGSGEKKFRHGAHRHKCHKASNKKNGLVLTGVGRRSVQGQRGDSGEVMKERSKDSKDQRPMVLICKKVSSRSDRENIPMKLQ